MILSMSGQVWLFLSTVLAGIAIGVFYDVFRILRKTTPHFALAVQLEDMFFWVTVTGAMFYFMLSQNYGEIRPFALIGAGCGVVLYFATVSRLILKFSVGLVNYLKKVFAAAFRIISLPVRFIWVHISPPVFKFTGNRRKDLHRIGRYGKMQIKKSTRDLFILRRKV